MLVSIVQWGASATCIHRSPPWTSLPCPIPPFRVSPERLSWGPCAIPQVPMAVVWSLSHVWLFATPWSAACQTPLSMGFSRQEYWSGILQGRILKWVAILFFKGSSQPRDRTCVSCIVRRFFTVWAPREAQGRFPLAISHTHGNTRTSILVSWFTTILSPNRVCCPILHVASLLLPCK